MENRGLGGNFLVKKVDGYKINAAKFLKKGEGLRGTLQCLKPRVTLG